MPCPAPAHPVEHRPTTARAVGEAVTVLLTALAGLAVLFVDVIGDPAPGADLAAVRALAQLRGPVSVAVLDGVSVLGSPLVMSAVLIVMCGWLTYRLRAAHCGRWAPTLLGAAGLGGIGVLDVGVKALVERPRPPAALHAVAASGYSFPSGHATICSLVTVLTALMLGHWVVQRTLARTVLWVGTVALIGLVGFSRVFLGVHYPTDVLAGWALGIAWALIVALGALSWAGRGIGGEG